MPSGNGSGRSGSGSNNRSSSSSSSSSKSSSSSSKSSAPSGTSARYGYQGSGFGGGNSKTSQTSKSTSSVSKSSGGGSTVGQSKSGTSLRATGGVTYASKGTNYSSADYARAGYGQYRQSPGYSPQSQQAVKVFSKDQSRIPATSSMQGALGLSQYVNKNVGPANPMARAMTGPKVSMQPGTSNYRVGDLAFNATARPPKQFMASIGDDMAAGIEGRVQQRVANAGPLRGVSTQGRAPMVSPMAGQGAPYPGPTSPIAGKPNFPAYQNRLQDTMMANYNRGLTPDIQVAGTPAPVGAPPQRSSFIGDDPGSFVSPNTLGRGVGGLIGGMFGGPAGGIIGAKLGGMGVDKAREYGHPLYGYGSGNGNLDANGQMLSGLGSTTARPEGFQSLDQPVNPAINSLANQKPPQAPPRPAGLPPLSYQYPQYTQSWANLPRGPYGR